MVGSRRKPQKVKNNKICKTLMPQKPYTYTKQVWIGTKNSWRSQLNSPQLSETELRRNIRLFVHNDPKTHVPGTSIYMSVSLSRLSLPLFRFGFIYKFTGIFLFFWIVGCAAKWVLVLGFLKSFDLLWQWRWNRNRRRRATAFLATCTGWWWSPKSSRSKRMLPLISFVFSFPISSKLSKLVLFYFFVSLFLWVVFVGREIWGK